MRPSQWPHSLLQKTAQRPRPLQRFRSLSISQCTQHAGSNRSCERHGQAIPIAHVCSPAFPIALAGDAAQRLRSLMYAAHAAQRLQSLMRAAQRFRSLLRETRPGDPDRPRAHHSGDPDRSREGRCPAILIAALRDAKNTTQRFRSLCAHPRADNMARLFRLLWAYRSSAAAVGDQGGKEEGRRREREGERRRGRGGRGRGGGGGGGRLRQTRP